MTGISQSNEWQSILEHAYLTSEKGDDVTPGKHVTNTCFAPLRYLLGGKRAEVSQKGDLREISFTESQIGKSKTSWKTALMVATILPGIAVGTVGLAINYLNQDPVKEEILKKGKVGKTTIISGPMQLSIQDTENHKPAFELRELHGNKDIQNDNSSEKNYNSSDEDSEYEIV